MKHFQDDCYDAMKDYEFSFMHHEEDKSINDDYDNPIGGFHSDESYGFDDGPTIRHFQDD